MRPLRFWIQNQFQNPASSTTMPTIRNIARGGGTYLDHRQDVFRELIDLGAERAPELSPFLSERFYKLQRGWTSFAFTDRDFRVLERLKKQGSVVSEANLLSLVKDYVRTNHESCREIQAANDLLSSRLLGRSEPDQAGIEFSPQGAPSLFAIKYACATQPTAAEAIRRTLERRFHHELTPRFAGPREVRVPKCG